MSQLGLGAMISYLGGNDESVKLFTEAVGKEIATVRVDDGLRLSFTDGTGILFFDDGQSCCEHRYMVCDDNLDDFIGATLLSAEVADADSPDNDVYTVHDVQFLRVATSRGMIVCSNHNEHNGYYYGGFSIRVRTA